MTSVIAQPNVDDWNTLYQTVPADEVPWELGGPSFELEQLLTASYIKPPGKVLDIGCGLGTQTIYFAKKGFEAMGIDIAESAIVKAEKIALFSSSKATFQVADVTAVPFASESFDVVYDRGCFHHLPSPMQLAYRHQVNRLVTDGGYFWIVVFAQAFQSHELQSFFGSHSSLMHELVYSLTEKQSREKMVLRSVVFEKKSGTFSEAN